MKARLGKDIVRCTGYGHIGDGNMHLNITSRQYDQEVMDKIEPFLYEWTSQHKGSISAEHGKPFFKPMRVTWPYFDGNGKCIHSLLPLPRSSIV